MLACAGVGAGALGWAQGRRAGVRGAHGWRAWGAGLACVGRWAGVRGTLGRGAGGRAGGRRAERRRAGDSARSTALAGARARGRASGRAAGRTVRAGHGRQAARARSLCAQAGPAGPGWGFCAL